jgi:hypothetical protein
LAKAANEKSKSFYKLLNDSVPVESQASAAAKVLLYSRLVEMDKIAECLGGKED